MPTENTDLWEGDTLVKLAFTEIKYKNYKIKKNRSDGSNRGTPTLTNNAKLIFYYSSKSEW